MNIAMINDPFHADLYGFSGVAMNKNWKETGFRLMNSMWTQIRSMNLKHKGLNIWVYEENDKMFTGVELENNTRSYTGLEIKTINLNKYVYYKHVGPYQLIGEAYSKITDELTHKGISICLPYLEIYGHWTEDESKLETELLWCVR